jgi:hypothetical protein
MGPSVTRTKTDGSQSYTATVRKKQKGTVILTLTETSPSVRSAKRWVAEEGMKIIASMPRSDARIFPYHSDTINHLFTDACKILEIDDLHFHDLRQDALSHFFETGLGGGSRDRTLKDTGQGPLDVVASRFVSRFVSQFISPVARFGCPVWLSSQIDHGLQIVPSPPSRKLAPW